MDQRLHGDWPVLRSYSGDALRRIAMPMGGIGTGCISLGGRGDLRDWEIANRPAKGYAPDFSFFCVFADDEEQGKVAKLLEGPLDEPLDSMNGFRGAWYGLPRFRNASFHAAYPFGQVLLTDDRFPLIVRIDGFNPLIPADVDGSSYPVAVMRVTLINKQRYALSASVCANMQNFIGTDGVTGKPGRNRSTFRETGSLHGLFMETDEGGTDAPCRGTMALAALNQKSVSHRTHWYNDGVFFERLTEFWLDFSSDGIVQDPPGTETPGPIASLCPSVAVPAGGEVSIPFLITWHFPNRGAWEAPSCDCGDDCGSPRSSADIPGNYYTTQFKDAWEVAEEVSQKLGVLENNTVLFVSSFLQSSLPQAVKEAALFNLSTLNTQTCFRTKDGAFFGWEGCNDSAGCCPGSCTHVWNYDQAVPFLFGELSRSMREIEFLHATDEAGKMSFRVTLPLADATEKGTAAADGQMGCIMKLYRDWKLCGDAEWLKSLWPKARKALEFSWIPGGWDADQDGVMEGPQHNTTDLEFYGPNPLVTGWYLGALRAAEEMALFLGEADFARACRKLFDNGSAWIYEHLFNGEYFEHRVIPPTALPKPSDGLVLQGMIKDITVDWPPQQPESGCMTDQLVGQFMAHICGLGYLVPQTAVTATLKSILKYNFVTAIDHANPIRAFTVNEERMLVYGSYPKGMPERPCFRFFENWTGVEYAAAILMIQEGLIEEGVEVIGAIRERFDGKHRNPFDEPECGHHYARALASWAAVIAFSGFSYSAQDGIMSFNGRQPEAADGSGSACNYFWSVGDAWGSVVISPDNDRGTIRVLGGSIYVSRLIIGVKSSRDSEIHIKKGSEIELSLE